MVFDRQGSADMLMASWSLPEFLDRTHMVIRLRASRRVVVTMAVAFDGTHGTHGSAGDMRVT